MKFCYTLQKENFSVVKFFMIEAELTFLQIVKSFIH